MIMRVTGVAGVLAGLLAASAAGQSPKPRPRPDASTLTAPQILSRMGEAYASCKTYQDSGVLTSLSKEVGEGADAAGRKVERRFATAFVRPDRFRLESSDVKADGTPEPRAIIWWQGSDVRTWSRKRGNVRSPSAPAIAFGSGPTGVPVYSVYTVPALLLTDQKIGYRLSDLTVPRRLDDAKLGDVDCHRVEGRYSNVATTVWLDKASFLVRRVDRRFQSETFSSDETTTYNPVVNAEVPPARLEFAPPAGAEGPGAGKKAP
jgi:outer membrane lipoprotein-sorting protein